MNENKNNFDPKIVVGLVGHTSIDKLPEIKDFFVNLEGFNLVYFKNSSEKLFITTEKPQEDGQ